MADKVTITNVYGGAVEAAPDAIGALIATLQCLPEALEGGDDEPAHTLDVLKRRLADLGLPFDRRDTAEYRAEMGAPGVGR